ncbi:MULTISPECIES: hypothetical protein [Actinomycetes]|uniref:Uncharacterized protein n=2 Tax=Actinomycetes TaxID=1760 RepID=A0ABP6M074_9MICC
MTQPPQHQPYGQQPGWSQPGYPGPPPGGPHPGYPMPSRPRPTRGPLPMTLGIIGGVLLLGAVVLFVLAVTVFRSTVPLGVLDSDGGPGADALISGDPPLVAEAQLEAGESYMLYVVRPTGASAPGLSETPEVVSPSGERGSMRWAEISSTATQGGSSAVGVNSYSAEESGLHEFSISGFTDPALDGSGEAFVVLAPGGDFAGLASGVFGVLGAVFGGIALGTIGLGLLIAGIVVGVVRRRRRREQEGGTGPGGPLGQGPTP